MKTLSLPVSYFASTSLSHCFSLLSAFLYSQPFQNIKMHCEIIDHHFNTFLVGIQLKNRKLESVLCDARVWVPKPVYRSPKRPEYVTDNGILKKFDQSLHPWSKMVLLNPNRKSLNCYTTKNKFWSK